MNLDVVLPHIPERRDGDSKAAGTADDIFTVLVFLDEHLQICKLPKYVADSPDTMPSVRLYEGDLASLMKILTKLENEVRDLHTAMAAITKGLEHRPASQCFTGSVINRHTDIDAPARVQPGSAGAGNANEMTSRDSHQRHRCSESVSEEHIDRDWAAAAASTPLPVYNRYSILPTDEEDAASMNGAVTEAGSRGVLKRRRQQKTATTTVPRFQWATATIYQRTATVTKPRTWSCDADWHSYSNWSGSYGGQEVGEKSYFLC